jgi:hypothetical protein
MANKEISIDLESAKIMQSNRLQESIDTTNWRKNERKETTEVDSDEKLLLGYLKGYNTKKNPDYRRWKDDPRKRLILDSEKEYNPEADDINTMVSKTESEFKFLSSDENEEPLFLTFDIILLNKNPLFDTNSINGVDAFLENYKDVSKTIKERKEILHEFRQEITSIFYTIEDYGWNGKKSYYIESLGGLDKLVQPIIKYKDDKLSVTLSEDIKMKANYIAELYNNLSYDYKFKREAIPENCLRFDMAIIMSDIRKMKIKKDAVTGASSEQNNLQNENDEIGVLREVINNNKSKKIFILRDCSFDFMSSMNHGSEISQGGWGKGADNTDSSTLKLEINYKSVERALYVDLFQKPVYPLNSYGLNKEKTENNRVDEKFYSISTNQKLYEKRGTNAPKKKNTTTQTEEEKRRGYFGDLLDKTSDTLIDTTNKNLTHFKEATLAEFREKRGELIDTFFRGLREETGVQSIYPDNVYDPEFGEYNLANFARNLGSDLYNDLESTIRGEINQQFGDKGL